ncbi:MAG: hypothetical protein ACRDYV_01130 [Acidimicrobiia bacterium]
MRISKKLAAVAIVAGVGLAASAAFAYWTTTGSGTGSGTVGTDTPWDVTSSPATGGPLTPGGPLRSIAFNVENDSTGHQNLNTVVVSVANANGSAWDGPGDCSAADFSVNGADAGLAYTFSPDLDLAAGGDYPNTITLGMVNRDADQNACRLATVPLYFYAS